MIELSEYQARRQALAAYMQDNSLCLIPAAREVTRSRDTQYPFRQDSDFYYLTGFNEPDAVLLISKQQGRVETVLFCLAKDPQAEIWHGRRMGPEQARIRLCLDKCFALEQLETALPGARRTLRQRSGFAGTGHNDEAMRKRSRERPDRRGEGHDHCFEQTDRGAETRYIRPAQEDAGVHGASVS